MKCLIVFFAGVFRLRHVSDPSGHRCAPLDAPDDPSPDAFRGRIRGGVGDALKCYMCNSKEDSRCLDPLDESGGLQLMNCTSDEQTKKSIEYIAELMTKLGQSGTGSFGKKPSQLWEEDKFPLVCQKLELIVEGEPVIGRGCSAPRMENFDPCRAVKLITSKDIVLKSCSLCDTDGCNAADRGRPAPLSALAAVALAGALRGLHAAAT